MGLILWSLKCDLKGSCYFLLCNIQNVTYQTFTVGSDSFAITINFQGVNSYIVTDGTNTLDQFGNPADVTGSSDHDNSWEYEDSFVQGENFPSNQLNWLVSAGEINNGRSFYKAMSLESYFARFQMTMDNKYHFMASTRYDGSSTFTEDNRWGSDLGNRKEFNVGNYRG